jgi:hypothetical protein
MLRAKLDFFRHATGWVAPYSVLNQKNYDTARTDYEIFKKVLTLFEFTASSIQKTNSKIVLLEHVISFRKEFSIDEWSSNHKIIVAAINSDYIKTWNDLALFKTQTPRELWFKLKACVHILLLHTKSAIKMGHPDQMKKNGMFDQSFHFESEMQLIKQL